MNTHLPASIIAIQLTEVERVILREACVPVDQQKTFPGLCCPERAFLIGNDLISPVGYRVEATELGHEVMAALIQCF